MTDIQPRPSASPFDSIRHEDDQGEYWIARELAVMLGYDRWENFLTCIQEAIEVYRTQTGDPDEVFRATTQNPSKKGGRPRLDYRLSRHACYLVAQSADGRKDEVAAAKTYFAVKTREQELSEEFGDPDAAFLEWRRRAILSYMARGYSREYSERRVDGITARNKLTHEWSVRGIKDEEFPILTDEMHMG